ncbi:MAG TPA: heme peroxidase family protein, partial [Roseiflexaceae bacterium]|nr:heme peroxidase family protein [Roseiflexaceae bacterium]
EKAPLGFATVELTDLQDFDFLFPTLQRNPDNLLPEARETRDNLVRLGQTMRDSNPADPSGNSRIPALFTYFGQFVDHDITLEAVSAALDTLLDPNLVPTSLADIRTNLRNARTATLDLDSVYGAPAPRDPAQPRKLLLGTVTPLGSDVLPFTRPAGKDDRNDLPREPRSDDRFHDRAALTGDPRNDENTIISQLHVAFLRAHNTLIDQGHSFRRARRILRQHYQHIVLHDFLKNIADPQIVDDILRTGTQFYDALRDPFFMPLEFSVAGFRFGHSMVRGAYDFNVNFKVSVSGETRPATLGQLFTFSALSGQLGFGPGTDTLPDNWIIEWENFVDTSTGINLARRIDTQLVEPLFQLRDELGQQLPGDGARLAVRNLLRGYLLRMPTGQAVAREMQEQLSGVREIPVLTPAQIEAAAANPEQAQVLRDGGFLERTPLWFYILAEAAALADGNHLGPVGSTLVAEVLVGLVGRSKDSILQARNWSPTLPSAEQGTFTLADLLAFAGVLQETAPVA